MAIIAESRRNNLWFGTLERMEFLPTPNRGANVSPRGWNAEGTLLNGGGFQLSSFDSHREYIFEWPTSSSRQVAQLMKSYSDGTYGRGLIYFVDPLTYDTNILPARWADPSMSIGVEGASLVYGVEPTGTATGGWQDNNLPVQSATYNLATTSAGWRGKEEAVFIPVPEGYTFSFGSIHSQTGQGRVLYRTQSKAGVLGAVTAVTPLLENTSQLVNTFISGSDLAGVWLFVGKIGAGSGSVTLTAMTGRLLPTVKAVVAPVATNLFTNPRLVGDGTWAEVARFTTGDTPPEMVQPEDFRIRDLGTGESVMEIEQVRGLTATNCVAGVSTKAGKPAVRLIPTETSNVSQAWFTIPSEARSGGTLIGTSHTLAPLTGSLSPSMRRARVGNPDQLSASVANQVGSVQSRLVYSGLSDYFRAQLMHGGAQGSGDVWWTDIGLFAGVYDGPAFNGSSGTITIGSQLVTTEWDGTIDNSTSTAYSTSTELINVQKGPWIGGQGHSGCRFVGKPTYIEYTGVNGGQVSFAATFREVGSWLHG